MTFVHLRVQSTYSLLNSTLKIEQIVGCAASHQMPAVAVTDKNNVFGVLEFAIYACKKGIQPIHGAILNICYTYVSKEHFGEILILAKNEAGYQNLLKLASYPYIKNPRNICEHITLRDLEECSEGLIVLSSYTKGIIGQALLSDNQSMAEYYSSYFERLFGDNYYFEISRHNVPEENLIEYQYVKLATRYGIPLVATNSSLFSDESMFDAHDTLLCIAAKALKVTSGRPRSNPNFKFKSTAEMLEIFRDIPEAIANAVHIAKRCHVMSVTHPPMLPSFAPDKDEVEMLRSMAMEGLARRLDEKFQYAERDQETKLRYENQLSYELDVICRMHFEGYFLIVSDFILWSKKQNIAVGPGRGSGAGSVVSWSLGITDLDPLRFGLIFERFLNPERVSMPDFDIDFCQERREEVINYVKLRYGTERVGHIITFGTLQPKVVLKDTARVLGLRYKYAERLTDLIPFNAVSPVSLTEALEEVSELRQAHEGGGLYGLVEDDTDENDQNNRLIQEVISIALKLEGGHRHVSVHAAGFIICEQDLIKSVALYKDVGSDMLVVQCSMKYAELAGLVKFDFLGLQTLTVISKCLSILETQGIKPDMNCMFFEDKKTYEMLARGDSGGVFQLEGRGMRAALTKMHPTCIDDLMALTSLYRPGPIENIRPYIARKHGQEKPNYIHPMLEPILKETFGVIIYQEQVLDIAKVLAGYSSGSADLLRRAMGKKIKAEMDAHEKMFIEGARKNNVSPEQAKEIFDLVAKFAGYGFNKAHAASYAVISYHTAYLKANYTTPFLTACLNLHIHDHDKVNIFLQEARNHGISVLSQCINNSCGYFEIKDKCIVFAFGAIKGVTPHIGECIVEVRNNKPFKSIVDFINRVPAKVLNKKILENLIKAGTFDKIHPNRKQIYLSIEQLLSQHEFKKQEKQSMQFSLLSEDRMEDVLIETPDWSLEEKAFQEYEVTSSFLTFHPLALYQDILKEHHLIKNSLYFDEMKNGTNTIKLAAIVLDKSTKMSPRGRFITLQLSDQYNIFEVTVFDDKILKQSWSLLEDGSLVMLTCEAVKDEANIRLMAIEILDLKDIINTHQYKFTLYAKSKIGEILSFLQSRVSKTPNADIKLVIPVNEAFDAVLHMPKIFGISHEDARYLATLSYEANKVIAIEV